MILTYVTFLARDVDRLADFYVDGLGLEEIAASRDHRYREVKAGGMKIGFAHSGARADLNLPEEEPAGHRALLTFDAGDPALIAGGIERAVRCGGALVRDVMDTFFRQRQAVLADPEGNLFRISAGIGR